MDLPTFFLIFIKSCILFENKYKKNEVRCTLSTNNITFIIDCVLSMVYDLHL